MDRRSLFDCLIYMNGLFIYCIIGRFITIILLAEESKPFFINFSQSAHQFNSLIFVYDFFLVFALIFDCCSFLLVFHVYAKSDARLLILLFIFTYDRYNMSETLSESETIVPS